MLFPLKVPILGLGGNCNPSGIRKIQICKSDLYFQVPLDLLKETARLGRLPIVNFAAGGLATPADCSLLMQLVSQTFSSRFTTR